MNIILTKRTWDLLNIKNISQEVDGMMGKNFDEGKKDFVKQLVKPFLQLCPGPEIRDIFAVDWEPGEDDGEDEDIRTIRLREISSLGRGDSVWVTCYLNGGVPGGKYLDFMDGSAAESGIVRVVLESLAMPTRRMQEGKEERPWHSSFRVKVGKIIPMEQFCLYFQAGAASNHCLSNLAYYKDESYTVDVKRSHNDTVVSLDYDASSTSNSLYCYRIYKQVDGTWIGVIETHYTVVGKFLSKNFELELFRENQIEDILEHFREVAVDQRGVNLLHRMRLREQIVAIFRREPTSFWR